ncbi:MAG TPA: hypothetical protein VM260_12580 [Pirellula sp.]|nr:hypothetical protein [Pirellula sp.]
MMSKPPPLHSPPIPQRERESDAINQLYWMIAPAVLLGMLLAIFFLSWLVNRPDVGQMTDVGARADTQSIKVSLYQENGTDTNNTLGNPATAGDTDHPIVSNAASDPITDVDPDVKPEFSNANMAGEVEELPNNLETALLIFEEKLAGQPVIPPQSVANGASLANNKTQEQGSNLSVGDGDNPFIGTGTPAKATVYVIDVSGSMQTPDRLPRVLSTLKRAVDLLKPNQTFTVILFDQGFYTDPSGNGLQLAQLPQQLGS